ncbi:MAG: polyprenyl diphosphate synthase [Pseudomonadota bacterium]
MQASSEAPDWTTTINKVRHIAIIMDGNQRWARAQGLNGIEGHSAGARALKRTVRAAVEQDVEVLTVFAFSSENWRRPELEVQALMTLFMQALTEELDELFSAGVQLRFIGDLSAFNPSLRQAMAAACEKTQNNSRLIFNVAVNYGGRWDIVNACRSVVRNQLRQVLEDRDVLKTTQSFEDNSASKSNSKVGNNTVRQNTNSTVESQIESICETIQEHSLDEAMALADLPAVDLCIRTSGEYRLSNFLLWQLAYAELAFIDTYWPDFNAATMAQLIQEFQQRQRRFGRTSEQISHLVNTEPSSDLISEVHWSTKTTVME